MVGRMVSLHYDPDPALQVHSKRSPSFSLCSHRPKYYASGFKKPGKEGFGTYRALLISGPPGIGKTTSAHLIAKLKGYSPIELNASDARSKKLIQVS